LSGIAQDASTYVSCVQPRGAGGRKGLLALVTEPAGEHPALSTGACGLVHDTLIRQYISDASLSLTSGLLKALDGANGALLNYNYRAEVAPAATGTDSVVAVQSVGARARRSQVGLTAVLLRPDGDGVYLAQMLPTQAYVLHQGHLSALPEPASWQRPGKVAVTLRRVPDPDEEAEEAAQHEDDDSLPAVTLPSTPLGSGPSVEVDLLYRRVEPGDLIAVVSSSLARQLDRPLAEEIFSTGSADAAIDALYTLATERGLAQAHACVLQVGVEASSGVDLDYQSPGASPAVETITVAEEPTPIHDEQSASPSDRPAPIRFDALKATRLWLSRLRVTDSQVAHTEPGEIDSIEEIDNTQPEPRTAQADNDESDVWTIHQSSPSAHTPPTQILLQHTPDVPPYTAPSRNDPHVSENHGELEFDGWEDVPPALGELPSEQAHQSGPAIASASPETITEPTANSSPWGRTTRPKLYPVPTIFDEEDEEPAEFPPQPEPALPVPPASRAQTALDTIRPMAQRTASWVGVTLRNLLPDSAPGTTSKRARKATSWRPRRELIAIGVAALVIILALSLYTMTRNPKHNTVNQFLAQAQQEDLLANQPSTPASERETHLNKVMELAAQALQVEPDSAEAARLLAKAQATLDTVQGIKRVEPKLLFDLEEGASPGAASGASAAGAISSTGQLAEIVVAGNDAYVLDVERGRVYRCRVATSDCSVVLKVGDDIGGQKVGSLVDMTMRVGTPVVLDNNFVTFAFSPETSAWQAQPLGGGQELAKPKDIATYDGNLYLLDAIPQQVSKYLAGQYAQPPGSWITDAPSVEQVKDPISLGIDGVIYVLLADGRILVMQGGKVTRTIPAIAGDQNPPTQLFTSTDTQDLYLLKAAAASLVRMSKEGQVRLTLKPTASSGITDLSAITVDEGSGKYYMLSGRKVYEANLRPPTPGSTTAPGQPTTRPTAEP
jgi:hypothetical protein